MKKKISGRFLLSFHVIIFVTLILGSIQVSMENPIILAERFMQGAGWIEIILVSAYAGIISWNMYDKNKTAQWRIYTWTVFSVIFFLQLILGLSGYEKFLMTGKLHLPVPMMIMAGPVYRHEVSFMTILFISTVILTGPSWCSHLCYFGSFDGIATFKKNRNKKLYKLKTLKYLIPFLVIFSSIVLRAFKIQSIIATYFAASFGLAGIFIIIFISVKNGKMAHCVTYCPIGTIVNYLKYINPIRFTIRSSCDSCMKCTIVCKYDALNKKNINYKKPGITCTLCGDCISSCHQQALQYKLFNLSAEKARNVYLFITVSVHTIFLALARI